MLERAWDRWRDAHGLAAEPLPPVSSYVGYSIEEPWGRPRVVFGVDAGDAEKLATLLQDCAAAPRVAAPPAPPDGVLADGVLADGVPADGLPQPDDVSQALDTVRAHIPAQGRIAELNGPPERRSVAALEHSGAKQASGSAAGSVNGFHPVEAGADPEDQDLPDPVPGSAADPVPGSATADFAVQADGTGDPAAPDLPAAAVTGSAADDDLEVSAVQADLATPDDSTGGQQVPDDSDGDQQVPDDSDGDQQKRPAGMDGRVPGESPASQPQAASDVDGPRDAGRGLAETMAAELAGWAAGELPGQASARLAAWATVGGATPRSGADARVRTGGAAEPMI